MAGPTIVQIGISLTVFDMKESIFLSVSLLVIFIRLFPYDDTLHKEGGLHAN